MRPPSLKPLRRTNSGPAFAITPMFSWPMSTASAGTSGMGKSRISVFPGPVRTAARTFSLILQFLMESRADAATRVKSWTRQRFGEVTVLVSELEGGAPGFPPLHTVVAFWTADRRHYRSEEHTSELQSHSFISDAV